MKFSRAGLKPDAPFRSWQLHAAQPMSDTNPTSLSSMTLRQTGTGAHWVVLCLDLGVLAFGCCAGVQILRVERAAVHNDGPVCCNGYVLMIQLVASYSTLDSFALCVCAPSQLVAACAGVTGCCGIPVPFGLSNPL